MIWPQHQDRPRRSAFTLLEVLVALCIFAMAAVVLGSSYLNVLLSYETVTRALTANEDIAFARQIVLTEPDRKKLEEGGEFETSNNQRVRWSVEIESSSVADVFKVNFNCEVNDATGLEPEKRAQTFMVLRPTWVIDAAERGKLKEEAKTRILEIQGKRQQ
jgi:general secretion pathway protein I